MIYTIIGSGRQGIASAFDLGRFGNATEIRLYDLSLETSEKAAARLNRLLNSDICQGYQIDVTDSRKLRTILSGSNGLLAGVPYKYLPDLTETAIDCGVHMVDYGGNTDNARKQIGLSEKAINAGISVIPECGMGPGMNITLALLSMEQMDSPRKVSIWDGGLPVEPRKPWDYSLFFNIEGLTNEYDGNAYFLEKGELIRVPCFERIEQVEFPQPFGTLEAAVTSGGLSTMPWSFSGTLETLENKTLRYPGHWEWMKAYRQLGLFSQEKIKFQNKDIVPREFYHHMLEPQLDQGRIPDVCLMRVQCKGFNQGKPQTVTVDTAEYYDRTTGFSAMEKWTGWHASILLIAAVEGKIDNGVIPVEKAISGEEFLAQAKKRGYQISIKIN